MYDIIEITEDLMKEYSASHTSKPAPAHEKSAEESSQKGERSATKHGEGRRPVGHDSVC